MNDLFDTIVAICTPRGYGSIGVIRISGIKALDIVIKLSRKKKIKYGLNFLSFFDKNSNLLDKGIAIFFKMPASFTGEDVVEIHVHGNDVILDAFVLSIIEFGARIANAGEFSLRAYLNGKIDLVQADAINSLIKSRSLYSNSFIFKSLLGNLSKEVKYIIDNLDSLRLEIEAVIEFSDHIYFDFDNFYFKFLDVYKNFNMLYKNVYVNEYLNTVFRVVVLGNVNVGKSSLFNCLLKKDRSIISDIPGTTRDFVDSDFFLNGFAFKLIDTAGFNSSTDSFIEKMSIEKTIVQAKNANIIIFVVDIFYDVNFINTDIFKLILTFCKYDVKLFVVNNKIDLIDGCKNIVFHDNYVEFFISVKQNYGIELLINELSFLFKDLRDNLYLVTKRQMDLFDSVNGYFNLLLSYNKDLHLLDLYAEYMYLICKDLSEIIGKNVSNDILSKIFSKFCVGK